MKKLVIFLLTIMCCSVSTQAQFLKNVLNSAKTQAERSVEKQVEKKIDQGIEKIFNPKTGQYEPVAEPQNTSSSNEWVCLKCGKMGNTGKFCSDCGAQRPEVASGVWTCPACGHTGNEGNFCGECGTKRPSAETVAPVSAPAQVAPAVPAETEAAPASNEFAMQMAAFQAMGNLTAEELQHLFQIGKQVENLTDQQVEAWIMAHPEELAFIMSLQSKLYNGAVQSK